VYVFQRNVNPLPQKGSIGVGIESRQKGRGGKALKTGAYGKNEWRHFNTWKGGETGRTKSKTGGWGAKKD